MFLHDNPFDTLAVHFYYYRKEDRPRDTGILRYSPEEQMKFIMEISQRTKKPLFIGEFGQAPDPALPVEGQIRQVETMLQLIAKNRVQLSALWNYDFDDPQQKHCNITPANDRARMLEMLREMNKNYRDTDRETQ
jgi:hypothetical protein